MDQPQTALEQYSQAAARQPGQMELLLGQARVHDALNNLEEGVKLYKQVCSCLALAQMCNALGCLHQRIKGCITSPSICWMAQSSVSTHFAFVKCLLPGAITHVPLTSEG